METARRSRRLKPRVMRALRVSHRWIALVLGLLLLVVTLSGALLLFKPEIERKLHPSLYRATRSTHPLPAARALAIVEQQRPKFGAAGVGRAGHVWMVNDAAYQTFAYVDPGTGHINGVRGETGVFAFLDNLHECGLSCPGMPGHIKALEAKMPGLGVPGLHKVTIAGFVIGVAGLTLVVLIAGGLVLWWPGVRRWRRGFQVRRGKGRYGRDYDLHKLLGFVALPFLALWAFTGTNFELPVLRDATDLVLPGKSPDETTMTFRSLPAKKGTPDIGEAAAERAAVGLYGGGRVVSVTPPLKDDPTSAWSFCVEKGFNWWRAYSGCAGGKFVSVDRHDAARVHDTWHVDNVAQAPYGKQTEGLHFGVALGWFPRLLLLVMGLTPVALAFTGMSTWLYRRAKHREARRRRALATAT